MKDIKKDIQKKFTTTIIGSLAKFEESFGYLWDNDTEAANAYYQLWMKTRNDVLNHGNRQLRSCLDILQEFLEHEDKYPVKYEFVFDDNKNKKETKE